jgi:phosphate transport system permease protein
VGLGGHAGDRAWNAILLLLGGAVLLVMGVIVLELVKVARPALASGALRFLVERDWDPVAGTFGALPFMYGTLVTSAIALVLAVPVSVGLALFLSEMGPKALRPPVSFAIETLAAIPSVVYGLWGLFVLVPWLRTAVEPFLSRTLGLRGAGGRAGRASAPSDGLPGEGDLVRPPGCHGGDPG